MNQIINAIIIDDEVDSGQLLYNLLSSYPKVRVLNVYTDPTVAIKEINIQKPDLLFLDIEMPLVNGFELIDYLEPPLPHFIFVTAYNHFALQAIKVSALDYILKPVQKQDLTQAIEKIRQLHSSQSVYAEQISNLQSELKQGRLTKIAITESAIVRFIEIKDIVYIEARGNYVQFYLANESKHLVLRTLKQLEEELNNLGFIRVNRNHIINLNYVTHMNKTEGSIILKNGVSFSISRIHKDNFENQFKWI